MGLIDDIIKALPENSILREKVRNLDAENTSLKAEVASLKDDKRELIAENKGSGSATGDKVNSPVW